MRIVMTEEEIAELVAKAMQEKGLQVEAKDVDIKIYVGEGDAPDSVTAEAEMDRVRPRKR